MTEKGKLHLEWGTPPLEFWISDTAFENLSGALQILYLWSRIQGGGGLKEYLFIYNL